MGESPCYQLCVGSFLSEIAKLEKVKTKLSAAIEQLRTECQAHTEKGNSLQSKLDGKMQECDQFQIQMANLEAKLDSANVLQAEVSDQLLYINYVYSR